MMKTTSEIGRSSMWLKLEDVVEDLLRHSGFGEIRISMRWVSRGRKEVIISYGKEFRFVLDAALPAEPVSNP